MTRSRALALLAAVLASAVAATTVLWVTAAFLRPGPFDGPVADGTWVGRSRGWFTATGVYPAEFDEVGGRHFSWTTDSAQIVVADIDRRVSYRIRLRVRAGRGPDAPPPPEAVVSVDGIPQLRVETSNDPSDLVVETPPGGSSRLVLSLDLSNSFVPGPGDTRVLGVVVEGVSIEATNGGIPPTARATWLVALATALYAIAVAAAGFRPRWVATIGLLAGIVQVWLATLDAAFLGPVPERLLQIGLGVGCGGAAIGLVRRLRSWQVAPEWPLAAAVTLVLAGLKVAVFWHPAVTIGDSIFQVHRAQDVAAGHYFFTSITPRPFLEFPYAIALYVGAMPFWDWFPSELDRVRLLRALTIGADAGVGLAMFFALRRAWASAWPAMLFAVLWPFVPGPVGTLCTSNLTNLLGQGVFGVAMGWMGWVASGRSAGAAVMAGVAGLLAVSFLSHFSTLAVGVPLVAVVGALLFVFGRPEARRTGVWVIAALVAAAAVAWVVYYSHFLDIYRETIARVVAREGAAETRSLVVPPSVKADRWWREILGGFGVPILLAAVPGAVWLVRRRLRDPMTLVLAGWGVTWLLFSALGIFTAVEMRANLAAAPFVLALAVGALGSWAARSRFAAAAVIAISAWVVAAGFDQWAACLTR